MDVVIENKSSESISVILNQTQRDILSKKQERWIVDCGVVELIITPTSSLGSGSDRSEILWKGYVPVRVQENLKFKDDHELYYQGNPIPNISRKNKWGSEVTTSKIVTFGVILLVVVVLILAFFKIKK